MGAHGTTPLEILADLDQQENNMTELEKQLVESLRFLFANLPRTQNLTDAIEVIDVEICKTIAKRILEAEYGVSVVPAEEPGVLDVVEKA